MGKESILHCIIKQRIAENREKLDTILEEINTKDLEMEDLRQLGKMIEAKIDSDEDLLRQEEKLRKDDKETPEMEA